MNDYRFYLDGTLITEPIGWADSEKKAIRNTKYNGIFIEYINKLIFNNDGYDYLLSQINTNGFCGEVQIDIYILNGLNYEVYFEGIIKLSSVIIKEEFCRIECAVEDRSLSALFIKLSGTKVRLNTTKTISGEALSTVEYTCNVHRATNASTSIAHDQAVTMYKVYDTFQYLLNYISDNRITFASDLFSTEVSNLVPPTFNGSILFTNPGVDLINTSPDPNLEIDITNAFGEIFTLTIPKQATVAGTLNYAISQFNYIVTGTKRNKFYTQDWRYLPRVVTNGTTTITITSHIKGFEITDVRYATSTYLIASSGLADEYGSMSICNGNQLRGVDAMKATLTSAFADVTISTSPEISFDDLWDNMNKCMHLGMSLKFVSGVLTMRIERDSYFLSSTESESLINVNNIITKASEISSFTNISVGDGGENTENTGTQNNTTTWITSSECFERSLSLKHDWIVDSGTIDECLRQKPLPVTTAQRNALAAPDLYEGLVIYNTDTNELNKAIDNAGGAASWVIADSYHLNTVNKYDDKIFILECYDALSNGTVRSSYAEHRMYSSTAAAYVQYWAFNPNLINYNKIRSWMNSIKGNPSVGDYVLTNEKTLLLIKEFSFDHYINITQERNILNNIENFIRFNSDDDATTGRVGWVQELARNNKTGVTKFRLIGNK